MLKRIALVSAALMIAAATPAISAPPKPTQAEIDAAKKVEAEKKKAADAAAAGLGRPAELKRFAAQEFRNVAGKARSLADEKPLQRRHAIDDSETDIAHQSQHVGLVGEQPVEAVGRDPHCHGVEATPALIAIEYIGTTDIETEPGGIDNRLGERSDIPRQYFLKLLNNASAAVRGRLEAANPQLAAAIAEAVDEVATEMQHAAREASREHLGATKNSNRRFKAHPVAEVNVHAPARAQERCLAPARPESNHPAYWPRRESCRRPPRWPRPCKRRAHTDRSSSGTPALAGHRWSGACRAAASTRRSARRA